MTARLISLHPASAFLLVGLIASGCLTPDYDFREEPMIIFATGGEMSEGSGGEEAGDGDFGGASPTGSGATPSGDGDDSGDGGTNTGGADGSGGDGTGGAGTGGARSTDCYGATPILFNDEFESGADCWSPSTTGDWTLLPTGGYSDSQGFSQQTSSGFRILAVAGEPTWDNVHVQAYIKVLDWGSGILQNQVALIARYQDASNFYYVSLSALGGEEKLRLMKSQSGISTQIGESHIVAGGWQLDTWYQIAIEVNGSSLRGFINGVPRLDDHMDASFAAGEIAIGTMSDATIVVDGVQVTQL